MRSWRFVALLFVAVAVGALGPISSKSSALQPKEEVPTPANNIDSKNQTDVGFRVQEVDLVFDPFRQDS
jgi:hypothetical protein